MRTSRLTSLLALLALAACGAPQAASDQPPADQAAAASAPAATSISASHPELDKATELGVVNAREPLPGIVTSGQPTEEQMAALAEAGVKRFISLRPATEEGTGWEEAWAEEHGAFFWRLPIGGAADLTRENVELLDKVLNNGAGEPTVLYCHSSNRAGAMLALRAAWVEGVTPGEAIELGKSGGMTGLEQAVTQLLLGS
jgi:uncharacterized protein (TIGR01244 family)